MLVEIVMYAVYPKHAYRVVTLVEPKSAKPTKLIRCNGYYTIVSVEGADMQQALGYPASVDYHDTDVARDSGACATFAVVGNY